MSGTSELQAPTPALRALPVEPEKPSGSTDSGSSSGDNPHARFYNVAVSLREAYDGNLNTQNSGQTSTLSTILSARGVVDRAFPEDHVTAGYSFGVTYYQNQASSDGTNGSQNEGNITFDHNLELRETHTFSERLTLSVGDDATYSVEPNIYQNAGTQFNNGEHLLNTFSASLFYQWTPLIGFTGTYANTLVRYLEQSVSLDQDSIENSASATASFAILPKVSASAGIITDDIAYSDATRGYTDVTLFGGANWQVNPDLSVSGRGGATVVEPVQGKQTISPYAALTLNWNAGPHTRVSADYSHEITPSSQVGAQAQASDHLTVSGSYTFNERIIGRLQASYIQSVVSSEFSSSSQTPVSGTETTFLVGPSLSYSYNTYLSFDVGISYSGNKSEISDRTYNRAQAYVGVRGTY